MIKSSHKIPLWGMFIIMVLIPVIQTDLTPEPTITIRHLVFSGFLLICFLYFIRDKNNLCRVGAGEQNIFLVFGLFVVWNVVCGLLAVNVSEALFNAGRLLLFICSAYLVYSLIRQEPDNLKLFFKVLTLIGLFHALVGLLQFYGFILPDEPGKVPYAFSANRTLYASSLALLLPFSAGISLLGKNYWRVIASLSTLSILAAIILTQTRSAWVAIIIAFLFLQLGFIRYRKNVGSRVLKTWWQINLGGGLLLIGLLLLMYYFDIGSWIFESLTHRIQSLFGHIDANTVAGENIYERLNVWRASLMMLDGNWLIGVGPGNWKITAPEYLSEVPSLAKGDYMLLRPHNSWLQITLETGLVGLAILMTFGFFIVKKAIRLFKSEMDKDRLIYYLFISSGLVIFAVDCFFSFPDERIEHLLYLSIMIGLLLGNSQDQKTIKIPKWMVAFVAVLILSHLIQAFSQLKYQYYMQRTYSYWSGQQFSKAIEESVMCKKSWPTIGPDGNPVELMTADAFLKMKLYSKAIEELRVAGNYHPNNFKIRYLLAFSLAKNNKYDEALKAYEDCLDLVPLHEPSHYGSAQVLFEQGKLKECLSYIDQLSFLPNEAMIELKERCRERLR